MAALPRLSTRSAWDRKDNWQSSTQPYLHMPTPASSPHNIQLSRSAVLCWNSTCAPITEKAVGRSYVSHRQSRPFLSRKTTVRFRLRMGSWTDRGEDGH